MNQEDVKKTLFRFLAHLIVIATNLCLLRLACIRFESWDELVGDATVFATASHQHLYGLLFGVLWPLCAERAFQSQHLLHAGELIPRLRAARSWALAGVPTHLKRFARQLDAAAPVNSCRAVFSSGGPLDRETTRRVFPEFTLEQGQPTLRLTYNF